MPPQWFVSLGEATEQLRERHGVPGAPDASRPPPPTGRGRLGRGFYDAQVVQLPGVDALRDETLRPDSTPEALAGLRPSFRLHLLTHRGTVTAGTSPLSDDAAAAWIGSARAAGTLTSNPLHASRAVERRNHRSFGFAQSKLQISR